MPKLKTMTQSITKAGIDSVLDDYNLDDPEACDIASELVALQMFTLHNVNKGIDYNEYDKMRLEAFTFSNCIHRRLLDFIDCMEKGDFE